MSNGPASSERGLLDTSVVIAPPRLTDPSALPPLPHLSAVTLAELSVGPLVARTPAERAARAFGRVAAAARRAGRKPQARSYDAMIAAVALANAARRLSSTPSSPRVPPS